MIRPLGGVAGMVAGVLFLGGCTTVGPDFKKPDVPVAETWLNAEDKQVDTSTATNPDR